MLPQWTIEKKRDGGELTPEEIRGFVNGYAAGDIPDYQMSALAMAIFFRGMTFPEVVALTDAMLRSGDVLTFPGLGMPTADKHSTGGIGDKLSLILAPLVACCGVAVPMLSGRGLGLTGGTLDKLESIAGYRTDLTTDEFRRVLGACGCSIMGQTAQLAPVDKQLYALRDVTGTVPSIPLIAASIMSKKLAEGADTLVLDVKWGSGAFMRRREDALELARTMVEIGARMGRRMAALLTDMNEPLGRAVGNATEVREAVAALQGQGPEDVMTVTMALAARMLILTDRAASVEAAVNILRAHIESGRAFERFCAMVRLHGGDSDVLTAPDGLPRARLRRELPSATAGTVLRVDAEAIGRAVAVLGGGRAQVTDRVDHAVGIVELVKTGERVSAGRPLMVLLANDEARCEEALRLLAAAVTVGAGPAPARPLLGDLVVPATRSA